ncbi:hypothetical protein RSSM_05340 [Rhodopirellula sallentina SM41]|uniref:Uncharacterized protein n=1 Tax=Rhodopirellula sallentina SM41 TaxID=1263870 RepID=M5U5W2_9BACT|nr:hypothetical protein RSSM_05340 [Rhodopirellula sallentina SM41]
MIFSAFEVYEEATFLLAKRLVLSGFISYGFVVIGSGTIVL